MPTYFKSGTWLRAYSLVVRRVIRIDEAGVRFPLGPPGCSISAVYTLGVGEGRVRFPASRPKAAVCNVKTRFTRRVFTRRNSKAYICCVGFDSVPIDVPFME